jgi:hypothetical protein
MALTDREIVKERQVGQLQGYGLAAAPLTAVQAIHSRTRDFAKVGTENAATNVAETVMFVTKRKARVKSVGYVTGTNVATDNTDYVVFTISKRTGATATTVATFNTHGGAQGAITQYVAAAFSVVSNSDSTLAADDILTYTITKVASGKALAIGTICVDLEEV